MKIFVTMKDPDVLVDAIDEGERALAKELMKDSDLTVEEAEIVAEFRAKKMAEFAAKYFKWGEYLTVELDNTQTQLNLEREEDRQIRSDQAQTFEDFGESTDVREGRAAAPRVTHVYQPWIEGLDVLVFVCNETMLNEGTARINSK